MTRMNDKACDKDKENKVLRSLVDWDYWHDFFQETHEQYMDEVKGMGYIDGIIHVAKRVLEERQEI